MSKITQSQIYLFLSEQSNWQTTADANNDGALTAYEFRSFLNDSIDGWNGLSSSDLTYDVVNRFWANLDQNNKIKGSTRDILDEQEMARAEVQVEAYKELKNFVDQKVGTDMPSDIKNSTYASLWKNEVISSLDNAILSVVQGLPKNITELTDEIKTKITNKLNEAYNNEVRNGASIQCYIEMTYDSLGSEYKSILDSLDNYSLREDKDLKNIINNWIKQNGANVTNIKSAIENLLKGYLATANIGNGNADAVKGLGKDGTTSMNEVQKASIKKAALEQLKAQIGSINITDRSGNKINLNNDEYKAIYEKYVEKFANSDGWYKNIKAEDGKSLFETIKANAAEKFKETSYYTMFQYEVQMADSYLNFKAEEGNPFYEKLKSAGLNASQIQELIQRDGSNYEAFLAKLNAIIENITSNKSDYLTSDGKIDFNKVDNALVDELKKIFGVKEANETNETDGTNNDGSDIDWNDLNNEDYMFNGYLLHYDPNYNNRLNGNTPANMSMFGYYNSGKCLNLLGTYGNDIDGFTDKKANGTTAISTAKTTFSSFIDTLKNACSATNKYNETALTKAATKIKSIYNTAFDDASRFLECKDTHQLNSFQYGSSGELYTYWTGHGKKESNMSATADQGGKLGLSFIKAYEKGGSYQITVDIKTVMDLFAQFYKEALGS